MKEDENVKNFVYLKKSYKKKKRDQIFGIH